MKTNAEIISLIPTRTVKLESLPPNEHTYSLAVVASFAHETPEQCLFYAQLLADEFADFDGLVQLLFSDNTKGGRFSEVFSEMRQVLSKNNSLETNFFHVPTPGKIHGINAGLEQLQAPHALFVDVNKQPLPGTLRGLHQTIVSTGIDLVSAQGVARSGVRTDIQRHNLGIAYITKTKNLCYYPPVLNEDNFIMRLNAAKGGSFLVDTTHKAIDPKVDGPIIQVSKRRARHWAGDIQLDKMRVINDGQDFDLEKYRVNRRGKRFPHRRLLEAYTILRQADTTDKKDTAKLILIEAMRLILSEPFVQYYYKQNLLQLLDKPDICVWNV